MKKLTISALLLTGLVIGGVAMACSTTGGGESCVSNLKTGSESAALDK